MGKLRELNTSFIGHLQGFLQEATDAGEKTWSMFYTIMTDVNDSVSWFTILGPITPFFSLVLTND